jgi:DNA mismatch repair protein MSH5
MGLIPEAEHGFRALRMAVHFPENDREQAKPLFRLEVGVASSSAGIVCAEMAGVKPAVIDRAREIVHATREKRKVSPLAEILRVQIGLTKEACELLSQFLEKDPEEMSDDEIEEFVTSWRTNLRNKRLESS